MQEYKTTVSTQKAEIINKLYFYGYDNDKKI